MGIGLGIIGLIIWIAIAFWPARVAGRKGHSFIGYFLLSILFFPLAHHHGVHGRGPLSSGQLDSRLLDATARLAVRLAVSRSCAHVDVPAESAPPDVRPNRVMRFAIARCSNVRDSVH